MNPKLKNPVLTSKLNLFASVYDFYSFQPSNFSSFMIQKNDDISTVYSSYDLLIRISRKPTLALKTDFMQFVTIL